MTISLLMPLQNKLIANGYRSAAEVAADIRLVWTNCMTYNQDGSEYYQLAEAFAGKFEEKYFQVSADEEWFRCIHGTIIACKPNILE
jgi:hypothetical protein